MEIFCTGQSEPADTCNAASIEISGVSGEDLNFAAVLIWGQVGCYTRLSKECRTRQKKMHALYSKALKNIFFHQITMEGDFHKLEGVKPQRWKLFLVRPILF